MFEQAIDFVLKGLNGAVDVLTDLNSVAPIIGIALVGFLILTVVSRLILPILGGTLPSGMADRVDLKTGRLSQQEYDKKYDTRSRNRKAIRAQKNKKNR
ncbi:MAG: hypothetical protein IJ424_07295 [Oscillospiraceae bacterium]|nr:hypothetical protein [Oscillospiraceae bacterium]